MYADDTVIHIDEKTVNKLLLLTQILGNIAKWLAGHCLHFHVPHNIQFMHQVRSYTSFPVYKTSVNVIVNSS